MIGIKKTATMVILAAGIGFTGGSQATLIDRGSGLIYDDVLNITWLQDANYAKTSGYDADGLMDWTSANTWATNLVYHDSVRNIDYSDWRLAESMPVNGNYYRYDYSFNGTTDYGQNIISPNNEMGYMYHINLGLKSYNSPSDTVNFQPGWGIFGNGTTNGMDRGSYGQNNIGLITNLQAFYYWSGSEAQLSGGLSAAWVYVFIDGGQTWGPWYNEFNAWAVRPGDVAPVSAVSVVPEPRIIWLFAIGLGLLSFTRRWKTKISNFNTAKV